MDVGQLLRDLLFDYTLRTVALGAATLGIISGALGAFAVLRRQSLLGDAMSHAALPGVALAFLLTGTKAPLALMLGAALAAWLAMLLILSIVQTTRVKDDSALGLVLSVFFGFGLMLLTIIQRLPNAQQAGLNNFLFGQAAAMVQRDVVTMAALGVVALVAVALLWKEFKLLSFDPGFGASLGYPMRALDVALTSLLVVAIVVGLQTVGVVLMSAMVVAPAAAARQWTDRLSVMIGLSAAFGALAGIVGAALSATTRGLSTGPTIVLCVSALALFSFLVAPNRGLLWNWARRQRQQTQLQLDVALDNLYALARQHANPQHGHATEVLQAMSLGQGNMARSLRALAARGWAQQVDGGGWAITPEGIRAAQQRHAPRAEEPR